MRCALKWKLMQIGISTRSHGIPKAIRTVSTQKPLGNGHETKSSDSEGNEYSIKSWSDSSGAHTVGSDGSTCTITPAGTMIGCD